jgi:2-polyprenyl-3-methyl-5-hydroxy-6-metoxy-1,4-benzoquinol methylase
MDNTESKRISSASNWYLQEQLDFDKRLISFRYKSLKPYLKGPEGLELGPAEGEMTQFLRNDFDRLTVVDGASSLLELIPAYPNVIKVHSLFEDFNPGYLFDTIIIEHVLEHIEEPVQLIRRAREWLSPRGRML